MSIVLMKKWQAEYRIRIGPRLSAALLDGNFRDVLQNGDAK
jgi:hypothetical protein